VRTKEKQ